MKARFGLVTLMLCVVSAGAFAQATQPGYDSFLSVVRAQVSKLGIGKIEDHMAEGYFIVLKDNPYADKNAQIGLSNLYDICKQEAPERWPAIIQGFFAQLKKKKEEQARIRPLLEKFETADKVLKVRVYPAEQLRVFQKSSIVDDTQPGYLGVVVVDYPSGIANLDASYPARWHMKAQDVFSQALKNTVGENKETFEEYDFRDGLKVSLLSSDTNPYVTTSIYDLANTGIPVGEYGTLVGIPNRMTIVAMALPRKELVRSMIMELMGLVSYMYAQGPGSISDNMYWYNEGSLSLIQKDRTTGAITLPQKLADSIK
ncbi:MAG TPA: hypothetical protein VL354_16955 [Spirochaetia bacterium]|nr:hypothetical protein [Spirochaetia bacterium]